MTALQVPDRVRWAVDVLAPDASTRILEVGCGPGAAAELICARLETGGMLAIDRSAVAVERTRRRNAVHVRDGRLDVRQTALAGLDAPAGAFGLAFSIDVNVFWTTGAGEELAVLRHALAPGGRLAILYGPGPSGRTSPSRLERVRQALEDGGFTVDELLRSDRGSGVIARAPR